MRGWRFKMEGVLAKGVPVLHAAAASWILMCYLDNVIEKTPSLSWLVFWRK